MDTFIQLAQLILCLSILVTLHELGHFLAARAFGIRVEKFYLFFDVKGYKLFSFTKGDTEYGIGWLPLGGYVKISGMIDESMDTEQMESEPQDYEFRTKKPWQKLIVMLGGIIMNVVLGIIIFIGYDYFYKDSYLPVSEINTTGIYAHNYAREAGLQTGDKIIAIRGEKLERYEDYVSPLMFFGPTLTVERKGVEMDIVLPDTLHHSIGGNADEKELFMSLSNFPMVIDTFSKQETPSGIKRNQSTAEVAGIKIGDQVVSINGQPIDVYGQFTDYIHYNIIRDTSYHGNYSTASIQIGVLRNGQNLDYTVPFDSTGIIGVVIKIPYEPTTYTFGKAIQMGTFDAFNVIRINAIGLKRIFTGQEKATDSLAGPLRMMTMFSTSFDGARFWHMTALLSMILALMNLLPIPALDGGHVVIIIIEWIRGKPISDKWMMRVQTVGLILVLGIMLFACGNDIWSFIKD